MAGKGVLGPLDLVLLMQMWYRYDLDILSRFNYLDVWSSTHLPASDHTTKGSNLTRRIAANRHRGDGCNNLFFDGHADWLHKTKNTARFWSGADDPNPIN